VGGYGAGDVGAVMWVGGLRFARLPSSGTDALEDRQPTAMRFVAFHDDDHFLIIFLILNSRY
jgi:hypothetical protein